MEDIKNRIEEYKGEITFPKENSFYDFYLYPIDKNSIAIEFDLWIDGSASDLTLSCYITNRGEEYRFGLQDLHTL